MRSAIIPFFNYDPNFTETKDRLYKFFVFHMDKWLKYVDKVYIIDSGVGLPDHDSPKVVKLDKPAQSHWQNMNEAVRNTKEDYILVMDSDMIIYKPEIIDKCFIALERGKEIVSIIDSSGSEDLWGKDKRRLAPYFCFFKKSILPPEFDFTPVGGESWYDSMGYLSKLWKEKDLIELMDDRSNIYFEEGGIIKSEQWLNDKSIPENPGYGYYHIRNFGQGLKMFNRRSLDPEIPYREAHRLLIWAFMVILKTGYDDEEVRKMINPEYMMAFQDYYKWFKDI